MEFKDRIKSLRMESHTSFSQLATMFNKTEGAIRAWELGRTKPDADTLIKLAEYFNCTADYLLGLSDFKNANEQKKLETDIGLLISDLEILPAFERSEVLAAFGNLMWTFKKLDKYPDLRNEYFSVLIHTIFSFGVISLHPQMTVVLDLAPVEKFLYSLYLLSNEKNVTVTLFNQFCESVEKIMKETAPKDILDTKPEISAILNKMNTKRKEGEPDA